MTSPAPATKKLAIVGAGSAGLISLYYAIRNLPAWEITCFETSADVLGSWGDPYPGFVSTTTKYTTQFTCHRTFDAAAHPAGADESADFFRDGEYGSYLRSFVRDHGLAPHIRFHSEVRRIERAGPHWRLTLQRPEASPELFDVVILCTGLAERPKEIDCGVEQLLSVDDVPSVTQRKVVVVGGGESAVEIADRLAREALGNEVFLSLRSGIRVSPRYHPIKGVPSDFLRNRLLLSIGRDLRNRIGEKFVDARVRYREFFERLSRRQTTGRASPSSAVERRKLWETRLREGAKDDLFHVFHNKSDTFLDAVGEGRLRIIGAPMDETYRVYADFVDGHPLEIDPDLLVPRIGFTSGLEAISGGVVTPSHFFRGCIHVEFDNLFLVGFARPIIGNIPGINEMQARYVTGLIAGRYPRPPDIPSAHRHERKSLEETYPALNTDRVFPVEMYPYCDLLAREMGIYPTLRRVGSLKTWLKIWLSPASTLHYLEEGFDAPFLARQPIHSPAIVTLLLLLVKLLEISYSLVSRRSG